MADIAKPTKPNQAEPCEARPVAVNPCTVWWSTDFFYNGTCRVCIPSDDQNIIDMRAEDEAEEEPEAPESDGTMLKSALMLTIQHWQEERPDAPECLVLSILESLTADWR